MGLLIDSEELVGAMATGIEDDIPSIAYRLTLDDKGRLQWDGVVDGEQVTENSDPLAGRWLRFKSWFLKIAPESQL
jgi:putative cardiolipin synthase